MRPGPLVAAAVLALAVAGCSKSSTNKTAEGQQANAGAQPAVAETPTMSPEDQAKALAALPEPYRSADLANGESKFGLCKSCHTITAGGANMTGPNLHGTIGKPAGQVAGFKYSDKLLAANLTWDPATLDRWIAKPQDVVAGSKMTFPGMKDPKDRTDLIAWMMIYSGS
jgi:cytochrome c